MVQEARTEVMARYRQRVREGTRTKLTQDELALQVLIESFLGLLQGAKTKAKIRALCEAELALLEEGYPRATVAKVYLPQ